MTAENASIELIFKENQTTKANIIDITAKNQMPFL